MKTLSVLLSLLLGNFALADAHQQKGEPTYLVFNNGALQAELTWQTGPIVTKESLLKVEWRKSSDNALVDPSAPFEVELWMPSMGHGSSPTEIQQQEVGIYEVSKIFFVMPGAWVVNLTLVNANGTQETQSLDVEIEGQSGHSH